MEVIRVTAESGETANGTWRAHQLRHGLATEARDGSCMERGERGDWLLVSDTGEMRILTIEQFWQEFRPAN